MSNYTPIIENAQPVTHYNFNDESGNVVDNIGNLNFIDNSLLTYQQTGALVGETINNALLLEGTIKTANALDTSTFETEFSTEFWVKPVSAFKIKIGSDFTFSLPSNKIDLSVPYESSYIEQNDILIASDGATGDYFGRSCALSGDTTVLVVGAYTRDSDGTDRGAVYTYDLVAGAWVERNILIASDGANSDGFGTSCILSSDATVLVVGAFRRNSGGVDRGAVYTYDLVAGAWVERNILIASDGANSDFFGISSTLSDDATVLVVGTHTRNSGGTDRGAVYTYDLVAGAWVERNILIASDGANSDAFGISSTLSSDATVLVVGSYLRDSGGISNSGAVYTYDLVGNQLTNKEINTSIWNHIVLNYKNNLLSIFKNGYPIHTFENEYDFDVTSFIELSGNAYIDELAVYNRVLGEIEIQSHYENGNQLDNVQHNILNSDPVAYFPMNDTTSTMESVSGMIEGEYFNNPTLNQIGTHSESVLFDGINQYAEIKNPNYNDLNVLVLLQGEASKGITSIIDESDNEYSMKFTDGVTVTSTNAKFNKSFNFDGSGIISIPKENKTDLGEFNFGENEFTYECFFRINADSVADNGGNKSADLFSTWTNYNNYNGISVNLSGDASTTGIRMLVQSWDEYTRERVKFTYTPDSAFTKNQWYHFAVCRDAVGADLKMYIDGVSVTLVRTINVGDPGNVFDAGNNPMFFGGNETPLYPHKLIGMMDSIRITSGKSQYYSNFTPPTEPFKLTNDNINKTYDYDQHFKKVSLLLNTNQRLDGTANLTDSSNNRHHIDFIGTAILSDERSKFGQSLKLDGNRDYLEISDHPSLELSGSDFTLECWCYLTSTSPTTSPLISKWSPDGLGDSYIFGVSETEIVFDFRDTDAITYVPNRGTYTLPINMWNHIALSYIGDNYLFYVNGILIGTTVQASRRINNTSYNTTIGAIDHPINLSSQGYISDIRITKGVGRYTETFNVPTRSFPELKTPVDFEFGYNKDEYWNNTSLLLHFNEEETNNIALDSSKYNQNSTVTNALIKHDQYKFGNTSMYFDGDLDKIQMTSNEGFAFGTADFTVEFHIRPTSNGDAYCNIFQVGLTNSNGSMSILRNSSVSDFRIYGDVFSGGAYNIGFIETELQLNIWQHVALVRHGTLYNVYVDGILSSTSTQTAYDLSRSECYIGGNDTPNRDYLGYLDEIRITKGIARYTNDFLPPIRAFSRGLGKFEHSAECWFNVVTATNGFSTIFAKGAEIENSLVIADLVFSTSGTLSYYYTPTSKIDVLNISIGIGTWNHFVVTIDDNWIILYLNGVEIGKAYDKAEMTNKNYYLASDENNVYPANVYISDFAIYNNVLLANEIFNRYHTFKGTLVDTAIAYYDYSRSLSPVNYYRFNDTSDYCNDELGHNNMRYANSTNGFNQASLIPADPNNSALDISNQSIITPSNEEVYGSSVTVVINIKLSSYETLARKLVICGKSGTSGSNGRWEPIAISPSNGVPANNMYYWDEQFATERYFNTVPLLNTPYQIAQVVTGSEVKVYINGVLDSTFAGSTSVIKGAYDGCGTSIGVTMDDLVIFDKVLTASEIAKLYTHSQNTVPPLEYDSVVATLSPDYYYKMNGFDTIIKEDKGGHNGILSGYIDGVQSSSLITQNTTNNKSLRLNNSLVTFPNTGNLSNPLTVSINLMVHQYQTAEVGFIGSGASNFTFIGMRSTTNQNKLFYYDSAFFPIFNFTPELNIPYNIVMVITSTDVSLYVDSVLQQTMVGTSLNTKDMLSTIGDIGNTALNNFTIDEVMLFNRVLDQVEISKLFHSQFNTSNKHKSYESFLNATRPRNYYQLNESIFPNVIDVFGNNNGVLSGNTYLQQNNSMLLSDVSNKSTSFPDSLITLEDTNTVNVKTLSFIVKVSEIPSQSIDILSGVSVAYARIDFPTNRLEYYNGTLSVQSDKVLLANEIYHVVMNFDGGGVTWYINGQYDIYRAIDTTIMDTIGTIGQSLGNIVVDEVVVYTDKNLTEQEIYKLYELAKFDTELLSGYRIFGTTRIEGSPRSLDIRLYQHVTGGLLSTLKSDENGNYEITGLQAAVKYDIIFYEEGVAGTCQEVYMSVSPELYKY